MRRRPGRAVALAAGILVASTSFTLLTSSVRTSQLITVGIVQRNARSAYDILVRPPGTRSPLELRASLVQDNFLSGIYGGITLRQYREIAALHGVAVAAPVANLGYVTALGFIKVSVAPYLTSSPFQAFRVTQVYSVGDGQHVFADTPQYVYVTKDPIVPADSTGLSYEIKGRPPRRHLRLLSAGPGRQPGPAQDIHWRNRVSARIWQGDLRVRSPAADQPHLLLDRQLSAGLR